MLFRQDRIYSSGRENQMSYVCVWLCFQPGPGLPSLAGMQLRGTTVTPGLQTSKQVQGKLGGAWQ